MLKSYYNANIIKSVVFVKFQWKLKLFKLKYMNYICRIFRKISSAPLEDCKCNCNKAHISKISYKYNGVCTFADRDCEILCYSSLKIYCVYDWLVLSIMKSVRHVFSDRWFLPSNRFAFDQCPLILIIWAGSFPPNIYFAAISWKLIHIEDYFRR